MAPRLCQVVTDLVDGLNVWKRGGQRAPHKPLLLLLALARVARGEPRLIPFGEIDEPLQGLLKRYGPPRKSYHPEYPFWRLQNDGLWEVPGSEHLTRRGGQTDVLKSELLKYSVVGGFPEPIYALLRKDATLRMQLASSLLDAHFPASLHADILSEVGLSLEARSRRLGRDAAFRTEVMRAYEHRCAVCGYDVRLGDGDLALEAGHIKWRQANGPDTVQNGLALCAIHHKALDRGAIGLTEYLRILVSADLYGQGWANDWFLRYSGGRLRLPHSNSLVPDGAYIAWHSREVFRAPARDWAG